MEDSKIHLNLKPPFGKLGDVEERPQRSPKSLLIENSRKIDVVSYHGTSNKSFLSLDFCFEINVLFSTTETNKNEIQVTGNPVDEARRIEGK